LEQIYTKNYQFGLFKATTMKFCVRVWTWDSLPRM